MYDFAACILPLPREGDGQDFSMGPFTQEIYRWVFHGALASQIAVHPFHSCVLIGNSAFGDQVVYITRPVLNG